MRIVASIQARMSSSRLPGKVMKEVAGRPILWWQIYRLSQSLLLDEIIVATSTNPADDIIAEFCAEQNVKCFRGPEEDVLERVCGLIRKYAVDLHVETFGDSPLVDAEILDRLVGCFLKEINKTDFVTNAYDCGFPAGADLNVYLGKTLLSINEELSAVNENREHVGYNILKSEKYKITKVRAPEHLYAPDLFIEIDTPKDFNVVSEIIEHFSSKSQTYFSTQMIIDFLRKKPELANHNKNVERRWAKL